MNSISAIQTRHADLVAEAEGLVERAGDADLDGADLARFTEIEAELDTLKARRDRLDVIARHASDDTRTESTSGPTLIMRNSDPYDLNDRRLVGDEVHGRALSAIEQTRGLTDDHKQRATELVETIDTADGRLGRHIVATGRPEYRSAFLKLASGQNWALTAMEQSAVLEARAASLTGNAGGFAVPFTLDSSLILTNAGSANPFRQISNVIPITTDEWKGVSTAGITASWDGEVGEVSDDAPVLVQPSIKTHKAQAFVPFSIEVGADWLGMESELRMAFTDAKDRLEATAFATGAGDGSSQPTGIVTALVGSGAIQTSVGADLYAVADVYATINKVAPRHRGSASWVAAYSTINLTRQFGTAVNHAFLSDLAAGSPPLLLGRPLYEASAIDGTINAAADNYMLIAGNFERYNIIDRIGMTVELVPHLFALANNRPSGQRGLYCYWRVGGGCVDTGAFGMLNVT